MKGYLQIYGHTAIDVILQTDELPEPNTSTAVKERTTRWGGTGANIAKAAADLGVKTGLSSFVGEDFPKKYKDSFNKSGIDLSGLVHLEGEDTPTCWIVTKPNGDQMALIDQGAMEEADKQEIIVSCIQDYQVIHIGTGRPRYYQKIMKIASNLNKTISFDPAQELKYVYEPEMFENLLSQSDLFFCNKNEGDIASKYLRLDEIEDILKYVDMMIVTNGDKGSTLYTQDGIEDIPPFQPKKVVDPTGAGDCYRAGFYAGLYQGYEPFECCLIGSARASFALESYGPQEVKVTWDDVIVKLEEAGYSIIN